MATLSEKQGNAGRNSDKKTSATTQQKVKRTRKSLKVGSVCLLKISALAPNNLGIDEFSYAYPVFVPKAKYGETVKAKVVKIQKLSKDLTYVIAQLLQTVKTKSSGSVNAKNIPVKPGSTLDVTITKQSKLNPNVGIVELSKQYKLIVPLGNSKESLTLPKTVKVTVTRVKENYAFASPNTQSVFGLDETISSQTKKTKTMMTEGLTYNSLSCGTKFTTVLPANSRRYGNYLILKVKGKILFVKFKKGIVLGKDKVRIKVIGVSQSDNSNLNYVIGKVLKVNPVSKNKKTTLVINSIRDMINHSMHFGEKAVKCHVRMKPYIWTVKGSSSRGKNRPLIKKGRHVINLLKTRRCLNKSLNALTKYALKGRTFLFIGTKKPAKSLVMNAALLTKNSFYVNTRWLGGMLTNWKTICKSISKIRPILKEKQKVVRDILEKRQTIKLRLIKKALLLKNKSKLILTKGRYLLNMFKNESSRNEMAKRYAKLTTKRNTLINKGMNVERKQRQLQKKRTELIYQTQVLKQKGLQISFRYKAALTQLSLYTQKLREYKYLLMLTKEIKALQQTKGSLYSVSYSNLKNVETKNVSWVIPNPPQEILNRIAETIKNENTFKTLAKSQTGNVVVCSSLLLRFAQKFSSYIKTGITSLIGNIKTLVTQLKNASNNLKTIQTTLETYVKLKNEYVATLKQLKIQLKNERSVMQIVKRQLKTLDAQKKFFKFFPRLRYLPIAAKPTKISKIVQILLSKIVDPKFKYPIDAIYDEKLSSSSKGVAALRKKKWQRLEKYFGGIANMTKLSKTTKRKNIVAIIIGQKEEMNAVRECQKLGIKTFTIADTDCNPTLSNHVIPANDDSRNSIKYILNKFIVRIRLAQKLRSRIQKFKK